MPNLVIRSNIKKVVNEIDKTKKITSVSDEVGRALEDKTRELLEKAIKRAEANNRKTLLARDL